jgi:hypothetical protein
MKDQRSMNSLKNQQNEAIVSSSELKFRCPECGCNKVLEMGFIGNEMKFFMDGRFDWGQVGRFHGAEPHYCCADCGHVLHDEEGLRIADYGELFRWLVRQYVEEILEKNGMK